MSLYHFCSFSSASGGFCSAMKRSTAWRRTRYKLAQKYITAAKQIIPTCVLRGISKVREVGQRTQPFGLRFQLCEPFAHLVNHLLQ